MTLESDNIKKTVKNRYGERARNVIELASNPESNPMGSSNCCSPSDMDRVLQLYSESEINQLPTEAVAASAGCGNPLALAGLIRGERVLDLGSGGGIDCFLAARQVAPEGHVVGLDMTEDMLNLARQNQAKLGITNLQFISGEIEQIPLPDNSVDVVISNCVVCLSPDKDAVFQETYRVLSQGGRIHLSDMMALSEKGPTKTDSDSWASCIAGAEPKETYLNRLMRAGFERIEVSQEKEKHDDQGVPLNVASVKVVAIKV